MRTNCDDNIVSYIFTTLLLVVIFALPICLFLASGFAIDIDGYGIKAQSDPIDVLPGMNIPENVLSELEVEENDLVVVSDSFYDVGMKITEGIFPWLFGALIILTPLSELIQFFIMRRKGQELELVIERSLLPIVVLGFSACVGGLLFQLVGAAATCSRGLSLEEVTANLGAISGFSTAIYISLVITIVLFAIPIIVKIFTKLKSNPLEEDQSEFITEEV